MDENKLELFAAYLRELRKIRKEQILFTEIFAIYEELQTGLETGLCEWIDIDNVGFVVIGKKEICPLEYDYYIIDTYIEPSSRRKGITSKIIRDYMCQHKGKYYLEVINDNKTALEFWHSIGELHKVPNWNIQDSKSTPYWIDSQ